MMIYFLLVPGIEKPGTFCIEKINLIACWAKAPQITEPGFSPDSMCRTRKEYLSWLGIFEKGDV